MSDGMQFTFLCHAPVDAPVARELAQWLELNTPCRIRLSECGEGAAHDMVEAADQGMSCESVVLLLSPASVRGEWKRDRWEEVLINQPQAGDAAALACLLLADCKFPHLLRRRDFFVDSLAGRRALKRWLMARRTRVRSLPTGPADAGAEAVEDLRCRLADSPGFASDVPRDLALAFARECARDFEGAVWVDGTRRSMAGIAGDLGHALGLALHGPPADSIERLQDFCASRRLLVVFDNCSVVPFESLGKCSVLRTAPHQGPAPLRVESLAEIIGAWTTSPETCLEVLRDLETVLTAHPWDEVRGIASSAVALLRHRERAGELLELVEALIPRAAEAGDTPSLRHFDWERSWILQAWGRTESVDVPILSPVPGDQLTLPFPAG
jgi:hypothetical protein